MRVVCCVVVVVGALLCCCACVIPLCCLGVDCAGCCFCVSVCVVVALVFSLGISSLFVLCVRLCGCGVWFPLLCVLMLLWIVFCFSLCMFMRFAYICASKGVSVVFDCFRDARLSGVFWCSFRGLAECWFCCFCV